MPRAQADVGNRWTLAADSTIDHLASHPSSRPDLTFLAGFDGTTTSDVSGHLACFAGGNFILGGLVLNEQRYIDFGLELVAGCEETYNQVWNRTCTQATQKHMLTSVGIKTLTSIGPEQFGWNSADVPNDQRDFYDRAGYYIINGVYILRPEVVESFYYAYRATGDSKYQDVSYDITGNPLNWKRSTNASSTQWAWNAFKAINSTCYVGSGYSEIDNVNATNGGGFENFQDSFLFAEVLKYR